MKLKETKVNHQMRESEGGAMSLSKDDVQVKKTKGGKAMVLPDDPDLIPVPEEDSHHIGIFSDGVILEDPEENGGKDR